MRLVILESPYAGPNMWERWRNRVYARACMHDCLLKGDAPFASHLLYTQRGVLRDWLYEERTLGIRAGFHWKAKADATVVYIDRGISSGMKLGIRRAHELGQTIEYRRLYPNASEAMWESLTPAP